MGLAFVFSCLAPRLARAETLAQAQERRTAEVRAEVARLDERAGAAYREAGDHLEKGELAAAVAAYERAAEAAPASDHPLRGKCNALRSLGRLQDAAAACDQAIAKAPTGPNYAAQALVALAREDAAQAIGWARRGANASPDDPLVQYVLFVAAGQGNDLYGLRDAVAALERLSPDDPETAFGAAVVAASEERWDDAFAQTERLARLGDRERADRLRSQIRSAQPLPLRAWAFGWRASIAWAVAFALLALLGAGLSHWTASRAVVPIRGAELADAQRHGRAARAVYRLVLWLTCAFYYLSIPLVLAAVVGAAAAVGYLFLLIGRIPIKLAAILLFGVCLTLWVIVRSLLVRARDEDPGDDLSLDEHPKLAALLREVAADVGTRPVDRVFVVPGTDLAVFERGGLGRRLRGAPAERCLILGVGLLDGMRRDQLMSVLAHEYGHFRNEDTAGGGFALAVRRSLVHTVIGLIEGGAAAWYNPAWWFVRGFHWVFERVSQGASRLQEVMADRWAVASFGSAAFASGFRHVIERSVRFDDLVQRTVKDAADGRAGVRNLYRYRPSAPAPTDLDAKVQEALRREASPFDSHPPPEVRLELAWCLGVKKDVPGGDAPAWDLFSDRRALERRMTEKVRQILAEQGVTLPAQGAEPADAGDDAG